MKIAYIFDQFPALSETFLAREVAALKRRGFDIEIWAFKAGEGAQKIDTPPRLLGGLEKHLLNREKSLFWRQTGHALARKLAGRGISHLHAAWASHPAQIAQIAAEKLNVPWSFAAHARDLWVEGGRLDLKLKSARFAVCCTRVGRETLAQSAYTAGSGAEVVYAPHGLDLKEYPFRSPGFAPEVRLLGVGRMVEKKGWLDLMAARPFLAAWERPVTLNLIGSGPLADTLVLKNSSLKGFQMNVQPAQSHRAVIEAMLRSDCLVVPSKKASDGDRDGLPNVILEAAAIGLPVVATRAGAIEEFLDDQTGWLCAPENPRAFAQTIWAVFDDQKEAERRAKNAFEKVKRDFDIEKNIEILANLFLKSAGKGDPLK